MTTVTNASAPVHAERAYHQALSQLRSIEHMVERLRCREGCDGEDDAREEMIEDPLSVETHTMYEILLCWGGPAVRIVGDLDQSNQPETAELQYHDWLTPWTNCPLNDAEKDVLMTYASAFCFE